MAGIFICLCLVGATIKFRGALLSNGFTNISLDRLLKVPVKVYKIFFRLFL